MGWPCWEAKSAVIYGVVVWGRSYNNVAAAQAEAYTTLAVLLLCLAAAVAHSYLHEVPGLPEGSTAPARTFHGTC